MNKEQGMMKEEVEERHRGQETRNKKENVQCSIFNDQGTREGIMNKEQGRMKEEVEEMFNAQFTPLNVQVGNRMDKENVFHLTECFLFKVIEKVKYRCKAGLSAKVLLPCGEAGRG